ncbi:MAG: sulfite exporter TauE/SafE family protein [Nitrolancea sp.]
MLAILLGTLIGLSLGMIGGGGSILTVPILVFIMGQDAHMATATSLAVVGATSAVGALPHWRAGRVRFRTAIPFGIFGIVGAFAGAWVNQLLPSDLILILFGVLMLTVAARMFLSPKIPASISRSHAIRDDWKPMIVTGLGVGVMTGFFGVGGGFLIVPALVLILGLNMRTAVGTSLVVIAINSASGLAAHLRYGSLDLAMAGLFTIGGAIGALVGASLAGKLDEQRLQRGFATFVALLGIWMVIGNLPLGQIVA